MLFDYLLESSVIQHTVSHEFTTNLTVFILFRLSYSVAYVLSRGTERGQKVCVCVCGGGGGWCNCMNINTAFKKCACVCVCVCGGGGGALSHLFLRHC